LTTTIGIACTNVSHAEDFNFTVPVQMQNLLPEVYEIKVVCDARSEDQSLLALSGDVGEGRRTVPVPDSGSVSTNVVVRFNARSTSDPFDASKYKCELWLMIRADLASGIRGSIPRPDGLPAAQPKSGTPLTYEVTGTIP